MKKKENSVNKDKTQLRENIIIEFLTKNGWGRAQRQALSSDASFRNYERLNLDGKAAMLMNAPRDCNESIEQFIKIDDYLRENNLNAPEIFASCEKNGLMLLEDFGDDSYSNVLAGRSSLSNKYNEEELYIAAMDVLLDLAKAAKSDKSSSANKAPDYDKDLLIEECKLFTEWFLPNLTLDEEEQKSASEEFLQIWDGLLDFNPVAENVLVLRDYHADNLMWLPENSGSNRVGLLDFQDAVMGSPVYDIISLLEDARRDVDFKTVESCIKYYLQNRESINEKAFKEEYAILAAQRNCKIIGIFARLAIRDNKRKYIDYMPRVWGHLENDLNHPKLAKLKEWFEKFTPTEIRRKRDLF